MENELTAKDFDKLTTKDFEDLDERVKTGDILKATKAELEFYAAMLCHPIWFSFHRNPKSQLEETVRSLLIVRMSEEANKEATRISKIALCVAIVALILSGVQAYPVLRSLFH